MQRYDMVRAGAAVFLAACVGTAAYDVSQDAPPAMTMREAAEVAGIDPAVLSNPLLVEWTGSYGGVPPWDHVNPEHFPAAYEAGIALRRAEVDAVASNPEAPTFANTIVPMERWGRPLQRVNILFGVMTRNVSTPEYQALNQEWSPRLAAASDEVTFNRRLFERIGAVYDERERPGLTAEQQRLVELTYDRYVRAGAALSPEEQARLGELNQRLASLFTKFSNQLLTAEDSWVALESEADLEGLSRTQIASARAAAEARGLDGWAIVITRSSVDPFLQFASRRDLREKVWKAFKSRGDEGDENDTNAIIAEIVELRAERARLLGFPSHAAWRMDDTMAGDPAAAQDLMDRVWPAAVARVRDEVAEMQALANGEGEDVTIEPWDYLYYAEKVRKARYDLDENEIRPYFELNNMIGAAFWAAEQLYDLSFREITGQVPVFHADVRVWEVTDKPDGTHRGLFYGDYYARPGKRSGAWASTYRIHETLDGVRTPLASNNNNFVTGPPGEPVLISLDDARTLFHEFGHALHSLLSEVSYRGLSSTPRDFVEYPSQVNEYWVLTRPVLDRFARHYETDAPMPADLVDRIEAAETFNQGYRTVEYLADAILDMELHTDPEGDIDPRTFESAALERIGMPREVALRHRLPQFSHLFSSDAYSAGYYSYLWSETMDADTRVAFDEAGDAFDRPTADRLRRYILAPGNSTDRAEAYRQFRGRDPDISALLRQRGLPEDGAR